MSSSISSATSQQQFVQVQQNAAATGAADKGNASANTNTQSTQAPQPQTAPVQTANQVTAGASAKGIPESKFFRNSDGTFGPNHTVLPPYNPLKPSTNDTVAAQALDNADGGVNVKI
jgi:hypothetical protein